jgi:hypothetical protein
VISEYRGWERKRWIGRKIRLNTMEKIEDEKYSFYTDWFETNMPTGMKSASVDIMRRYIFTLGYVTQSESTPKLNKKTVSYLTFL